MYVDYLVRPLFSRVVVGSVVLRFILILHPLRQSFAQHLVAGAVTTGAVQLQAGLLRLVDAVLWMRPYSER